MRIITDDNIDQLQNMAYSDNINKLLNYEKSKDVLKPTEADEQQQKEFENRKNDNEEVKRDMQDIIREKIQKAQQGERVVQEPLFPELGNDEVELVPDANLDDEWANTPSPTKTPNVSPPPLRITIPEINQEDYVQKLEYEILPNGWIKLLSKRDGQYYYFNQELSGPNGWTKHLSTNKGAYYFFNAKTGETVWNLEDVRKTSISESQDITFTPIEPSTEPPVIEGEPTENELNDFKNGLFSEDTEELNNVPVDQQRKWLLEKFKIQQNKKDILKVDDETEIVSEESSDSSTSSSSDTKKIVGVIDK
jgi:hypothetical protein